MDIATALKAFDSLERSLEVGVRRNTRELPRGQAERDDVKTSADDLAALLRRLSDGPTHEIEKLIDALQKLRKRLQDAGSRIQRDIAEYAELSEQIMQLSPLSAMVWKNSLAAPIDRRRYLQVTGAPAPAASR
jgi:ElaB/YqjD/DUF883 family membrane-anchored ribosome-binding protein